MNPENIRYIRLQNSDEVIAYVEETKTGYNCSRPVLLFVVNMFEDGKQLLNFREYLPPTIVDSQEIFFSKKDVVYIAPVRDAFMHEYIEMSNFFFEENLIVKTKKDKVDDSKKEKIVSIVEALMDKKGKPVH